MTMRVLEKKDLLAQRVLDFPRYIKRLIALIFDSLCSIGAVYLAFLLRLGDTQFLEGDHWQFGIACWISVLLTIPVFVRFGLYRAIFRYSGSFAVLSVLKAIAVYASLYMLVITVYSMPGIPRTVGAIQPLVLFFLISGSRGVVRLWLGGGYKDRAIRRALPKSLIYGAGVAGRQLAAALENSFETRVVGFLDDDSRLHGSFVENLRVYPPSRLEEVCSIHAVSHVLLAIPSVSPQRKKMILEMLSDHQLVIKTLPSMGNLVNRNVSGSDVREIDISDILGREVVPPIDTLLSKNVEDKCVLISGAGGSIGSELVRQLFRLGPKTLILLESSEYALYVIRDEIERASVASTNCPEVVPILASVQDSIKMNYLMSVWKPHTVYHAAAYKHVPMVEQNICEGIANNVFGTLALAQASLNHGVSNFILVSTDKAVRPTNVMGASKRLAEMCLQGLFSENFDSSLGAKTCRFSMVRFGNVIDSSGSVLPRFKAQIKNGGPVTLTDEKVTRFFMTISEAAELVIQSSSMSLGGDVFILDMGSPVRIKDVAIKMIEYSGLTVKSTANPNGDIEIIVTGLRHGEKLHEELLLGESPSVTAHPKILRAHDPFIPWHQLEPRIEILRQALSLSDVETVLEIMKELVHGYRSNENVVDNTYLKSVSVGRVARGEI